MSENANNLESNVYVTTDLYLSSYLIVKGHKLSFEKKLKKAHFSFPQTPDLDLDVNEYLLGKGQCAPLAYANAIKNLKNLLFNR
jgi:hypothetical protein